MSENEIEVEIIGIYKQLSEAEKEMAVKFISDLASPVESGCCERKYS